MENIENLLKSINLSKLNEEEADQITSPITEEENKKSIMKLKNKTFPIFERTAWRILQGV